MVVSRRYIKGCLDEVWAEAREEFDDLPRFPPKLKMTNGVRRAGSCQYEHNLDAPSNIGPKAITISKHHKTKLAAYDTVRHEVAHAVAVWLYGERGHGPQWKAVDRALGGDGERCHDGEETIDQAAYDRKHKYAIACQDCDYKRLYQRRGKYYKKISRANCQGRKHYCSCPKCGSSNLEAGPRSVVV